MDRCSWLCRCEMGCSPPHPTPSTFLRKKKICRNQEEIIKKKMSVLFPKHLFSVLNYILLPFLLCPQPGNRRGWGDVGGIGRGGGSPERWQEEMVLTQSLQWCPELQLFPDSPAFAHSRTQAPQCQAHVSFVVPKCSQIHIEASGRQNLLFRVTPEPFSIRYSDPRKASPRKGNGRTN